LIEKFLAQYEGKLLDATTRTMDGLEQMKVVSLTGVRGERIAEFEIQSANLTLMDYSQFLWFGTEYAGKIVIRKYDEKNEKIISEIENFCRIIFPINNEVLKYLYRK